MPGIATFLDFRVQPFARRDDGKSRAVSRAEAAQIAAYIAKHGARQIERGQSGMAMIQEAFDLAGCDVKFMPHNNSHRPYAVSIRGKGRPPKRYSMRDLIAEADRIRAERGLPLIAVARDPERRPA